MLKLLLLVGIVAAAYYVHRARELRAAQRLAELEARERARANVVDVEAEVADVTPRRTNPRP